jgi:hypothetical protein
MVSTCTPLQAPRAAWRRLERSGVTSRRGIAKALDGAAELSTAEVRNLLARERASDNTICCRDNTDRLQLINH